MVSLFTISDEGNKALTVLIWRFLWFWRRGVYKCAASLVDTT